MRVNEGKWERYIGVERRVERKIKEKLESKRKKSATDRQQNRKEKKRQWECKKSKKALTEARQRPSMPVPQQTSSSTFSGFWGEIDKKKPTSMKKERNKGLRDRERESVCVWDVTFLPEGSKELRRDCAYAPLFGIIGGRCTYEIQQAHAPYAQFLFSLPPLLLLRPL